MSRSAINFDLEEEDNIEEYFKLDTIANELDNTSFTDVNSFTMERSVVIGTKEDLIKLITELYGVDEGMGEQWNDYEEQVFNIIEDFIEDFRHSTVDIKWFSKSEFGVIETIYNKE
jgi:hypothetical protein